ncbi:SNT309 (YPR101W) [Zygosaccharomyces parabailii]|nr:SNT309 (YPR101W) [Zygosaccharomyces parabailii]CDH08666.1 uncharacterized protein ZBAI_00448 [Zygosaccharomyces bailii ISA1307]
MDHSPCLKGAANLDYGEIIEKLVDDQRKALEAEEVTDGLHPEVQALLRKFLPEECRFDSLYEVYHDYDSGQGWKRKRKEVEEATLEEYKKKHPRIGLARYSTESRNAEILGTVNSYLNHQYLVLRKCMPETILNQWAINNDYIEKTTETLQDRVELEKTQLKNLDRYRESVQAKNKPEFARLKSEWKQQLIKNANGGSS